MPKSVKHSEKVANLKHFRIKNSSTLAHVDSCLKQGVVSAVKVIKPSYFKITNFVFENRLCTTYHLLNALSGIVFFYQLFSKSFDVEYKIDFC